MEVFQSSIKKDLTKEIISNKVAPIMSDKKEVGERTILTGQVSGDEFIDRRGEKEEVLACQFVITS